MIWLTFAACCITFVAGVGFGYYRALKDQEIKK